MKHYIRNYIDVITKGEYSICNKIKKNFEEIYMKIYIHTDLEGIAGFVDFNEPEIKTGRGIQYTKELLTEEVNAAIRGIKKVDPNAEIVVQDGHGGGYWGPNFLVEKLDETATLIQGKRGFEIVGLDDSFDFFFHIGAHAMAGTQYALMAHTIMSDSVHNFWINDVKFGEIGIVAAIAGQYGVPVALVTGDYWAIMEAEQLLGDEVEGVSVKKGINMFSAHCLSPKVACRAIEEAAELAIKVKKPKPLVIPTNVKIKVEYSKTNQADSAQAKGGVRLDGRTVEFSGQNVIEAIKKFYA